MKSVLPAVALCLFAFPSVAQELVGFSRDDFGKVVLAQRQFAGDRNFEAAFGDYNNEPITSYSEDSIFSQMGRSVGRLDVLTDKGVFPCTAFIVSEKHIVTNNHCVPGILQDARVEATRIEAVQFVAGYVLEGVEEGTRTYSVSSVPVETDKALDYSVLEVFGNPSAEWGALEIEARLPKPKEPYWVIGHPMGEAQRISREKCRAAEPAVSGGALRHTCDTLPGNSGSPVIDASRHRVVALHHAGSRRNSVNYAIPMAHILEVSPTLAALRAKSPEEDQAEQATRLQEMNELVDTLRAQMDGIRQEAQNTGANADARISALSEQLAAALSQLAQEQNLLKGAVTTNADQAQEMKALQQQLASMQNQMSEIDRLREERSQTAQALERETNEKNAAIALTEALIISEKTERRLALSNVVQEFADTSAAQKAVMAIEAIDSAPTFIAEPLSPELQMQQARLRCVLQAASPYDPDRDIGTPGVAFEKIDTQATLALCQSPETRAQGAPETSFVLGRAFEASGQFAEARANYRVALTLGSVAAGTALGRFARDGKAGERDVDEAIALFEDSAKKGDPVAMTFLADLYSVTGGLTRRNFSAAQRHLEHAVALEHPQAVYALAKAYEAGSLYPKDPEKRVFYLSQSAQMGDLRAQIDLAELYWEGLNGVIEVDLAKGLELMISAAETGDTRAQSLVGVAYLKGKTARNGPNIAPDPGRALSWLARAAEGGYVNAQMALGKVFEKGGDGIERDAKEALRWYEMAAKQDYVRALVVTAEMYETGTGTDKDPRQAAWYWLRSLEKGNKQVMRRRNWPRSVALEIQSQLRDMGFYSGPVDGAIGRGSRSAMNAFFEKSWRNQTYAFPETPPVARVNEGWVCQC